MRDQITQRLASPRGVLTAIWTGCAVVCSGLVFWLMDWRGTSAGGIWFLLGSPPLLVAITSFILAPWQLRLARRSLVGTVINFAIIIPALVLLIVTGVIMLWMAAFDRSTDLRWGPVIVLAVYIYPPHFPMLLPVSGLVGAILSTIYARKTPDEG
jgi:hypothetical protein